jgi:hypothetical protein
MASPHPPASPERELTPQYVAHAADIVWGAPSDEMLDAEARGEIILVEDINRGHPESSGTGSHWSGN